MKPSILAAKMYKEHRIALPFNKYTDEELMSAHNFIKESGIFFSEIHECIITDSLVGFESYLASVLALRGKMV